jgi:hypothetical protein
MSWKMAVFALMLKASDNMHRETRRRSVIWRVLQSRTP